MTSLPVNDAKGNFFLPGKWKYALFGYLPKTQEGSFSAWAGFRILPMTQGGYDFLSHRTAASELDLISEIPLGVSLRALSRASSARLGARNTAVRPGALQPPLIRSTAGLPWLEHPAGRNLATVSFASFDLL